MGVLRSFGDREEAERAWGWLRRSALTPGLRDVGDGRFALEVPAGQEERAKRILEAVAGVEHLADLPRTPWWRRVLTWDNLATLSALVIGVLLAVLGVVLLRGWVRWFGLGGALVFCLARVAFVAYSGDSAANEHPEPISRSHGVITQDEAAFVSYRRAWIRQTWALINWRQKTRLGNSPPVGAPRPQGRLGSGAKAPQRAPAHLVRCDCCGRLVDVRGEWCPFCKAPRPGGP